MSDDKEPLRSRKRQAETGEISEKAEEPDSGSSSSGEGDNKDKELVSVDVEASNKRHLTKLDTDDDQDPVGLAPGWACLFGWVLGPIGVLIVFLIARKQIQLSVMGFVIEIVMIIIACEIAFLLVHT
jgi:hypothetical protein